MRSSRQLIWVVFLGALTYKYKVMKLADAAEGSAEIDPPPNTGAS